MRVSSSVCKSKAQGLASLILREDTTGTGAGRPAQRRDSVSNHSARQDKTRSGFGPAPGPGLGRGPMARPGVQDQKPGFVGQERMQRVRATRATRARRASESQERQGGQDAESISAHQCPPVILDSDQGGMCGHWVFSTATQKSFNGECGKTRRKGGVEKNKEVGGMVWHGIAWARARAQAWAGTRRITGREFGLHGDFQAQDQH